MNVLSDDSLYGAFLKGDNSAYDKLMLKYGDSLTAYLKGFLYSWEDAEDLMIEAFARVMVKKPKIEPGNFKAYLYKTAHNLVSHFYKKSKRRKDFSIDEINGQANDSGNEVAEPSYEAELYERVWGEEKDRIVLKCLERIGEDMREALWLFYFDELTYREAASVMNVSYKKIDNLLARGKICLKKELEKEGITDAF